MSKFIHISEEGLKRLAAPAVLLVFFCGSAASQGQPYTGQPVYVPLKNKQQIAEERVAKENEARQATEAKMREKYEYKVMEEQVEIRPEEKAAAAYRAMDQVEKQEPARTMETVKQYLEKSLLQPVPEEEPIDE